MLNGMRDTGKAQGAVPPHPMSEDVSQPSQPNARCAFLYNEECGCKQSHYDNSQGQRERESKMCVCEYTCMYTYAICMCIHMQYVYICVYMYI